MFTIERTCVRLNASPVSKEEAIRLAGTLLADAGYIDAAYIESMLQRESSAHTYIGGGIAIPHGLPKNRDRIKKTGVSIVQIPGGVPWQGSDTVYTVLGIAAMSDEHIEVLRHITHLLDDEKSLGRLRTGTDPDEIIGIITGVKIEDDAVPSDLSTYTFSDDAVIQGRVGLHARPATIFVETAKQFSSDVLVRCGNRFAQGKSLASLLKLGSAGGSVLTIFTRGADAREALRVLAAAVAAGLGEEEEAEEAVLAHGWTPETAGTVIGGLSASGGIAIGPVRFYRKAKVEIVKEGRGADAELLQFEDALKKSIAGLEALYVSMKERSGEAGAVIFKAHIEFLKDEELLSGVRRKIREGQSAAWAWTQVYEENAHELESLADATLKARAADVRDVGTRVLRHLAGAADAERVTDTSPYILLTDDLSPSDTAQLDPSIVLGFCTSAGAPTSHSAITARSLGIPAVTGCGDALFGISESALAVLDGTNGKLYLGLSQREIDAAGAVSKTMHDIEHLHFTNRYLPAVTKDGYRMEIAANIASADDAARAVENGAEGIGLMRSEFLFLDRTSAPDEEEQYRAYCAMIASLGGLPLIIRTLDIGGDKNVPYLDLPHEDNSFLGVRGIRLCLAHPDLFKTQLRAIYRASKTGPVKIMFPMIAIPEELIEARALCEEVRAETGAGQVPIGIMIEVPSAVVLADELARNADFFSIGTNDLTQYMFAMDRLNPALAAKADGLHPAILRMIDRIVSAGIRRGIPTGVCGGIAGDALGALILTGLGVRELSVSIPSVPEIKAALRATTFAHAAQIAAEALRCSRAADVRRLG
jgi:phosphocarrier protein FPr